MATEYEIFASYDPADIPPRAWHVGPTESDMIATGVAYFRTGKRGVSLIRRDRVSGDVYVELGELATLVHTQRGWGLLAKDT